MGGPGVRLGFLCLVGGEGLVHPAAQLGDAGVDGGGGGGAAAASPGHDAHQSPGSGILTDQRTTRVSLQGGERQVTQGERHREGETGRGGASPCRKWLQLLQHRS